MRDVTNGEPRTGTAGRRADGTRGHRLDVTVLNPKGFHLRPAAAFAKIARAFPGSVTVSRDGRTVDGKSPLDLLLLAADPGTVLTLEVHGAGAEHVVHSLAALLANANTDEPE